jgi:lysophospholipase
MTDASRTLERANPRDPRLAYELHPAQHPRVALLLTHGYAEHRARYAHVIDAWNRRGVTVASYDLRGHGRSEGIRGHVERFSDYVRDAVELLDALEEEPAWRSLGAPIVFGHSLGGLITIHLALAIPSRVRAIALSSPFLGLSLPVSAVKAAAGRAMSKLLPAFAMPTGLTGADVTRDPDVARRYDEDPLGNKKATARFFTEALAAHAEALARAAEITAPFVCLQAGADKVVSVAATERFVERVSSTDKTFRVLPGLYHEIMNEPERAEPIELFGDAFERWSDAGRDARAER